MRVAPKVEITESMQKKLNRYSKASNVSPKLRKRSKIVLMAAEGNSNKSIAAELGIDQTQVGKWRKRFVELGLRGIEKDAPRPGRFKPVGAAKEKEVIEKTLQTKLLPTTLTSTPVSKLTSGDFRRISTLSSTFRPMGVVFF